MAYRVIVTSTNDVGRVITEDNDVTVMFEASTEAECNEHISDKSGDPKWPFADWVEGEHGTITVEQN